MESDKNPADRLQSTRRDVLKMSGVAGLFAAATSPAVAEEALGSEFTRVDDLQADDAIDEAFTPSEWLTVGPFAEQQIGERSNDWLAPLDSSGERGVADGDVVPTGDEFLPSAYGAAARAQWQQVELDEGETTIPLNFFEATDPGFEGNFFGLFGSDPDTFQWWYGIGGVLFTRSYAYTTFERDEAGVAVVESDAFEIWVNGTRIDRTPTGVVLQEGTNHVLLKQSDAIGASADFEFRPPRAPVEANSVERVPDLVEGEGTDRPAAVRVTNVTPDRVENATVTFEPEAGDLIETQTVEVDPPLAPFETRIVNTQLTTTRPVNTTAAAIETVSPEAESIPAEGLTTTAIGEAIRDGDSVTATADSAELTLEPTQGSETTVVATVTVDGEADSTSTGVTVRGSDENRIVTTYLSAVDESVQLFGFRRPANFEETTGPYELLLNLHGAGVDADSSAGSIAPRDDLYVIGPETRGALAFDHENIGRVDDLEALEVAKERFDVDENSVYLTGHSMGGHGTLHVGLYHTEKFGGIAPAHGWTEIESYISPSHKRDRMHTHPQSWDARETSLHKSNTQPFTENLLDGNTPMFVLHGGLDTAVPPIMPRHTVRTAASRGLSVEAQGTERYDGPGPDEVDVAYLEVPGAGHVWDRGFAEGGADSFNHPDMFEFLRDTTLDPYPESLHFYTVNLGIQDSKQWVTVRKQRVANAETRVTAELDGGDIVIDTENVRRLAVDLEVLDANGYNSPVADVIIDGETVKVTPADTRDDDGLGETPVVFDLRNRPTPVRGSGKPGIEKTGELYGPARHVHYEPYRLVYGTGGSEAEREAAIELANIRSQALVDRARSPAIVIPDTDVTGETIENYNLILFGTPGSNTVLDGIVDDLPIRASDGEVTVGQQTFEGDLAAHFIYPNPENPEQFVQVNTGTSVAGLRLNRKYIYTRTFSPSADYAVFDDTFRFQAWNGCLAAGYFNPDWELDSTRGFVRREGDQSETPPGKGPGGP